MTQNILFTQLNYVFRLKRSKTVRTWPLFKFWSTHYMIFPVRENYSDYVWLSIFSPLWFIIWSVWTSDIIWWFIASINYLMLISNCDWLIGEGNINILIYEQLNYKLNEWKRLIDKIIIIIIISAKTLRLVDIGLPSIQRVLTIFTRLSVQLVPPTHAAHPDMRSPL